MQVKNPKEAQSILDIKGNSDRTILHCDCNSFFASVECVLRPELRLVPMAVCGDPASRRGIVVAKNELAKKFGVKTTDTVWQAKQKCPEIVLIVPHHNLYGEYCDKVNEIYGQYTDQVEAASIDESYLDVTGSLQMFGGGEQIADELRRRVREELGITISVGVSYNKVFAKLGSDYKKPDATTVITRENYKQILYPLPVTDMLYVGESLAQVLKRSYIHTIGDLAEAPLERIVGLLGKGGETLWAHANGLDESPVRHPGEFEPAKSVGNSITFPRDLIGMEDIRAGLKMLADSVGARLRAQDVTCQTVQLQIKNPSLKVICRQKTISRRTNLTREIYETAVEIIQNTWNPTSPIRMLMLTCSGLTRSGEATEQVSLFEEGDRPARERQALLEATVDAIRHRFGHEAIVSGRVVRNELSGNDEMKHD